MLALPCLRAVPNYNPREVVQNLLQLIDGQEMVPMHPWYKAFNGEITFKKQDKYQVQLPEPWLVVASLVG